MLFALFIKLIFLLFSCNDDPDDNNIYNYEENSSGKSYKDISIKSKNSQVNKEIDKFKDPKYIERQAFWVWNQII